MRACIRGLPDGTYSFEDHLDNDGITDEPLTDRARPDDRGRCGESRFFTLLPALPGADQHRLSDGGRRLLRRAEACLHRGPGQCRLPAPDRLRDSRHDDARREGAPSGRRLHGDDPAPDRSGLRRNCAGRSGAGDRRAVRNHQCALARRSPGRRLALGDVLVLRRRSRRQSGIGRAQPRQQPDLDGDDPAGGDPRSRLSGHVHAVGSAARLGRRRDASRRIGSRVRDRSAGGRRGRAPRRARQVPALRRCRRRTGRAEPVLLGAGGRREHAAACLQGRGRADPRRRARPSRDAGRRRLGRTSRSRPPPRRARREARLCRRGRRAGDVWGRARG